MYNPEHFFPLIVFYPFMPVQPYDRPNCPNDLPHRPLVLCSFGLIFQPVLIRIVLIKGQISREKKASAIHFKKYCPICLVLNLNSVTILCYILYKLCFPGGLTVLRGQARRIER